MTERRGGFVPMYKVDTCKEDYWKAKALQLMRELANANKGIRRLKRKNNRLMKYKEVIEIIASPEPIEPFLLQGRSLDRYYEDLACEALRAGD